MSLNEVTAILQEMLMTTLLVIAPMLLTSLVVGLGISIVQAATQINEQTLTFIPKIVLVLGVLAPRLIRHRIFFSSLKVQLIILIYLEVLFL